jgi:hypothetical protein
MLRHASGASDHELLSSKLQNEPPPIFRSFTIALLSNVRTDALSRIKVDLAAMVFGEKYETPAERATTRPDPKLVSQHVGRDSVSPKMVVTVTSEDGALFLKGIGGEFEPLKPLSDAPFFFRQMYVLVVFARQWRRRRPLALGRLLQV